MTVRERGVVGGREGAKGAGSCEAEGGTSENKDHSMVGLNMAEGISLQPLQRLPPGLRSQGVQVGQVSPITARPPRSRRGQAGEVLPQGHVSRALALGALSPCATPPSLAVRFSACCPGRRPSPASCRPPVPCWVPNPGPGHPPSSTVLLSRDRALTTPHPAAWFHPQP